MLRFSSILVKLGAAGVLLGVLAGGVIFIKVEATSTKLDNQYEFTPLPVASMLVERADFYTIQDRFIGQIEPSQSSKISFERGGLVLEIFADEGAVLKVGETIARLDQSLIRAEHDRLQGEQSQIMANLELANLNEARNEKLRNEGHVPQSRLDEARLQRVALDGQLTSIKAALNRINIDLKKTEIRAPYAGIVGARFVDTGTVVSPGAPLVELLATEHIIARIGISPEQAATLVAGSNHLLKVGGSNIGATLSIVRRDLSLATRTIDAIFTISNADGLNFGDIVELNMVRKIMASGYWLPLSAISEGQKGLWSILTLKPHESGYFQIGQEVVEVLHSSNDRIFVSGTIANDQRIVSAGRNRVTVGQLVQLTKG